MAEACPPTLAAAQARIAAVRPATYARTRNALDGAVSGLSPYLTHGFVTVGEVWAGVAARHRLTVQDKFVFELGWREYFRHVWAHRGDGILRSLHEGPLPEAAYAKTLPDDIRRAQTGLPVIDQAVRTLYATGLLHNHARMWLASYVVHLRKVHWRAGADWLYAHLLDGDLASNHLSWQWVAATGSRKPYLFNADNAVRYAPPSWHSPGTLIDTDYDTLDQLARDASAVHRPGPAGALTDEPSLWSTPPSNLSSAFSAPDAATVADRDVWLVHPWNLGALPRDLPADTLVLGLCLADFHRAWPWSERRWRFVSTRMAEPAPVRWFGEASVIGLALAAARSVRSTAEPHLAEWLPTWAQLSPVPSTFAPVPRRCDSFSQWWTRASRGVEAPVPIIGTADAHQEPLPW